MQQLPQDLKVTATRGRHGHSNLATLETQKSFAAFIQRQDRGLLETGWQIGLPLMDGVMFQVPDNVRVGKQTTKEAQRRPPGVESEVGVRRDNEVDVRAVD